MASSTWIDTNWIELSGSEADTIDMLADALVARGIGSGLSAEQNATLSAAFNAASSANIEATKGRKMQTNKAIISGDGLSVCIYDDDGSTLLHVFSVSADKNTRTPA